MKTDKHLKIDSIDICNMECLWGPMEDDAITINRKDYIGFNLLLYAIRHFSISNRLPDNRWLMTSYTSIDLYSGETLMESYETIGDSTLIFRFFLFIPNLLFRLIKKLF